MCHNVDMGPGRVERAVRRRFIEVAGPVRFGDLLAEAYADGRRPWRWRVWRACRRYGVSADRGWWAPNDALMKLICGE
jgi:hypothetical protein